jgi:iron complex outermembrane receptor protein
MVFWTGIKVTLILCIALLFCLFLPAQQSAQSIIRGRVVSNDGSPVAYVRIELRSLHRFVLSSDDGDFIFKNLPSLSDSLIISSVQYERHAYAVSVCCGNKLETGDIFLDDRIASLQNVEIKGIRSASYKNNYSFFGTKTQSPIKDIPQTISVVSRQLMQDRMDHSLNDMIENIAGVNLFSDYQEYTIRGFRAEIPRLINGLRTYNATLVPPLLANIERVEVIKGPASVLYSNSDPGGLINMVTKKPLAEKLFIASASFGSWNDGRLAADMTGPINKKQSLLYRLNTAYRTTGSFRDQLFDKSFQLAPSVSYTPNNKLSLNLDLSVSKTNSVVDRGQPGLQNDPDLHSTPLRLNVSQPGDYLRETDISSIITISYKFNQHISINSSYLNYIVKQQLSEHGMKEYITDDSVYLYYANRNTDAITHNITNYAVFNFNTGKLNHQLLAGYDIIANDAELEQWNGELPAQFGDSSGIVGTFSLTHPAYFKRPVDTYSRSKADKEGEDNDDAAEYFTQGIYLQEQLSWKKWLLLFSLRQEFYKTGGDDESAGNLDSLELRQNVLSPRIGITYKFNEDANAYLTWNKGFEPFEASANLPAFGGPFKPILGQLFEAGIKSEFFRKKLYAALSIYKIKQTNVLVNANDPSDPDRSVQAGSDASKGIELEANGNISSNLSIAVSYAYNVTKIISGNNPSEVGKIEANAPKNISGSWIKYHFNKGFLTHFVVAAGHSQVSKRNTYTDLVLPGYCIFNAGVGYHYKNLSINCNLNNITNRIYYSGAYNNVNKWPGKPFNVVGEIIYQFR